MSLGIKLKSVLEYYQIQVHLLMDVVSSTYNVLKNEYKQIRDLLNSEKYREKYAKYRKIMEKLDNSSEGTGIYLSKEEQEVYEKLSQLKKNIPKSEHLLNMALIYLMAIFEGFNKKFFLKLLINKPEQMRSKKKRINYENLLKFNTLEDLYRYLAEKITDSLGYKNIDQFNKVLNIKYKINLEKDFKNWDSLRDNYYRRNIIVHNNAQISKKCIKKLNISSNLLNSKPPMTFDYLTKASENLIDYMKFIFTSIKKKFSLDTSVKRYAPFPPNFDRPMVVKKGKEEISKED